MRYLSVCSGIEAATVAWHPLGWTPAGFSEVEAFPRRVLEQRLGAVPVDFDHRWEPGTNLTPLFGDFTQIEGHHVGPIDLLVGGTPCQAFSVAGKRLGMDDPRGNLTIEFFRLAERIRPRWLVWENVPGVLSNWSGDADGDEGCDGIEDSDFAAILSLFSECGYRGGWRVLDAQFVRVDGFGRAVPQQRRRVFLVGHHGNDARAVAALFDPESLRGLDPPSRKAGQGAPAALGADLERDRGTGPEGGLIAGTVSSKWAKGTGGPAGDECYNLVAHSLRGEGHDASEDGTGRGTPLVVVPFDTTQITHPANYSNPAPGDPCHPLAAGAHPPCVAFTLKDDGRDATDGVSPTLRAMGHDGSHANGGGQVAVAYRASPNKGVYETGDRLDALTTGTDPTSHIVAIPSIDGWTVRRLTPRECERLQGFPDDWTRVRMRHYPDQRITAKRPADMWEPDPDGGWWLMAADAPRYKAIGNSMAVNAMRWIGTRIALVEEAVRAAGERAAA